MFTLHEPIVYDPDAGALGGFAWPGVFAWPGGLAWFGGLDWLGGLAWLGGFAWPGGDPAPGGNAGLLRLLGINLSIKPVKLSKPLPKPDCIVDEASLKLLKNGWTKFWGRPSSACISK